MEINFGGTYLAEFERKTRLEMSALGHKRTLARPPRMSAVGCTVDAVARPLSFAY